MSNKTRKWRSAIAMVLVISMLFSIFPTAAFAQEGGRHRHRPREFNPEENAIRRTNRLHEAVQLDSLQFQAVYIMYLSDAMTMQDSITWIFMPSMWMNIIRG